FFYNSFVGGGFDHRVLAAHVIYRGRFVEALAHAPKNIDVRQRRLDHDDVRAFIDVQPDLAEGFVRVRRIHLVRSTITELWRAFGCGAKRAVKNGSEFRGGTHNARFCKNVGIKGFPNCADAAVHHVAGCDHVRAGLRVRERRFHQKIDTLVVQHMKMVAVNASDAAMAVTHVFTETNVRDRNDFRTIVLERAQRFLHYAILGISAARLFILYLGNSKKENGLKSGVLYLSCFIDNFTGGELKHAWHAHDRTPFVDLFADEKRQNKIVCSEIGLANEIAQAWGSP